jgi:hypothetical protein
MNSTELKNGLSQFTGTEHYYRHVLCKLKYTDGVAFFAENAGGGAYWFLDIVCTELMQLQQTVPFIHVVLDSSEIENRATLMADDGNDELLWRKEIEFTDCPPGSWEFYLIGGVLMLSREY